jgi:NAD-dependent DNA ligase
MMADIYQYNKVRRDNLREQFGIDLGIDVLEQKDKDLQRQIAQLWQSMDWQREFKFGAQAEIAEIKKIQEKQQIQIDTILAIISKGADNG